MRTDRSIKPQPPQPLLNRGGTRRRFTPAMAVCLAFCFASGCCCTRTRYSSPGELSPPERLDRGYTLVLPGLMGSLPLDHGIVKGLADADLPSAIEMYDWTEGPLLAVSNLRGLERNRREAQRIAEKIINYQDQYPGRPVHMVGYSAGAAMAVFTLEALPAYRTVTGAVLLAPTLSPDYDLRPAISHTESGIHSFYSPYDAPFLMAFPIVLGTSDGRHGVAAGAVGFKVPEGLTGEPRRRYQQALTQQEYTFEMVRAGHLGDHFGWSRPTFVKEWLLPLVSPAPAPERQLTSYGESVSSEDHLPRWSSNWSDLPASRQQ